MVWGGRYGWIDGRRGMEKFNVNKKNRNNGKRKLKIQIVSQIQDGLIDKRKLMWNFQNKKINKMIKRKLDRQKSKLIDRLIKRKLDRQIFR